MRRRLALTAALGLLVGCASTPPPASERWTSGRMAVRIAAGAGTGARSEAAAFELRGDGDQGELRLLSPLGTVVASARWQPGQVTLTTAEGEARFADLDELSRETFGEVLPLRALPDWLAGRPWPGAASQAQEGGFEQLGWRVDLARLVDGQLVAERSSAPAVVVRVRLDT